MQDLKQIKESVNIVDVISKKIQLKKQGSEYVGLCPFHEDDKPSLNVNEVKQIFKCFVCGCGGDVFDFYTNLGVPIKEAINEITNNNFIELNQQPKKPKPPKWHFVNNPPQEKPDMNHYQDGQPSNYWIFRDLNGLILYYRCRFDYPNGKKIIRPLSYVKNDNNQFKWHWTAPPKPRIIYNAHFLKKYPNATIVIVEGEKTADAFNKHVDLNKSFAASWDGGVDGVGNTDFSFVFGRKIILWPDNDFESKFSNGEIKPWHLQPGNYAMLKIHDIIKNECKIIKWVNNPKELPNKWDCADKDWKENELRDYVLENLIDVPLDRIKELQPEPQLAPELEIKIPPPQPPVVVNKKFNSLENKHYRILGYDKDENSKLVYFFFSFDAKSVIKLSPSSMNKSNLLMLAPINYWETHFKGGKTQKINIDAVQEMLIRKSHIVGTFRDKYIRGRGAWIDDDKYIIHTGETLIIDGKKIPLMDYTSKYVYEIGEELEYGTGEYLKSNEAVKLIEKLKWLFWEREINSYLLAGWCVIAPFCGVLDWRPHLWVTGPVGSGKSWVMDNIIKKLMNGISIVVQGKTTEAGVRGMLQSDARPVLFDESDVDSYTDKERIQSILALARSSSYRDGGVVSKGTQTGTHRSYTIRSCFAFSSVGIQLNQQSDRSRFTMLGLKSFEKKRTKEEFAAFELDWMKTFDEKFCKSLQTRTMSLLPIILENAKVFSDAAAHYIGNRRIGDQVGSMLAGAYSLSSSKKISYEDALEWVKKRDWTEEKGLELTKDEYQLLNIIMGYIVKLESDFGTVERSIGEIILIATGKNQDLKVIQPVADQRLRRLGILISDDKIIFSNTSTAIKQIIKDTSWGNNHNKILERIPNSEKVEPRQFFPGLKSRGVSIPISTIIDDYVFEPEPDYNDEIPF